MCRQKQIEDLDVAPSLIYIYLGTELWESTSRKCENQRVQVDTRKYCLWVVAKIDESETKININMMLHVVAYGRSLSYAHAAVIRCPSWNFAHEHLKLRQKKKGSRPVEVVIMYEYGGKVKYLP